MWDAPARLQPSLLTAGALYFGGVPIMEPKNQGWPVLTYHLIHPSLSDRNAVSPLQLAQHLDALLENGLTFRAIDDLYLVHTLGDYDEPGVLLAFDDGYLTTMEYAFPLLEERDIPFIVFVPVDYIGQTNLWNPKARYICQHLSWKDLWFLQHEIATIGSHACSHHSLVKFGPDQIEKELVQSKVRLENKLGVSIHYVAYPYGDMNPVVEKIASRRYQLGFSATQGCWSWAKKPWAINRILVTSGYLPKKLHQ